MSGDRYYVALLTTDHRLRFTDYRSRITDYTEFTVDTVGIL
jgi:serine/threonine protein phosphatase PrpC